MRCGGGDVRSGDCGGGDGRSGDGGDQSGSVDASDGDVSCDGAADSVDAALVLQFEAGLIAFLPCGANADVMAGALEVINFDENVKSIFINIFGGITRGEEVAKGIVEAMGRVDLKAPIVIRLDGTNAEEGRQILLDAGIPQDKLRSEPTMLDAARVAVELAN